MAHVLTVAAGKRQRITCLVVLFLVLPTAAWADTITLVANRDTSLYQDNQSNSDGAGPALIVGKDERSSSRRALVGFDIADNIPAGSIITGVQFSLFLEQKATMETKSRPFELHRLLDDWGEGITGQGSSAAHSGQGFRTPADGTTATWSHRFYNTMPWTTAGGDFAPAASGTTMVGTVKGAYVWDSTPNMVSDVQSWLDDPASNFGWLLLGDESALGTARRFDSREASNSTLRPALEITFSGSAVPEPCTLILLGLGAAGPIGYIWRRRKPAA